MRKWVAITALLVVVGAIYLVVQMRLGGGSVIARPSAAPPVVVAVAAVREEIWQPLIHATGSLRAYQGVTVTAQESGMVTTIQFSSGQAVSKGDLLLQQYVEDEQLRLKSVRAELALARKNYDRSQDLVGKQAVSQAQLDSNQSELERLTALVRNLELTIAKRSIRAPFDGLLGIRRVNPGQYIEPGDDIVTLESLDPIYIDFSLPQHQLQQAAVGQAVLVNVDAYPGDQFSGTISAIEPHVDASTRTFRVEAHVLNTDLKLRPGMFVNTRLVLPARDKVLTIPQAAVSYSPYGESVFVIESGDGGGGQSQVVKNTYLTLGDTRGDQVAVVSGLQAGDRIVTAGQLRLRNGSRVTIDERIEVGNSADPSVTNN